MSSTLDPQLKRALADRIRYYNELGIYDFYRRDFPRCETNLQIQPEERDPLPRAKAAAVFPAEELIEISATPDALADPAQGLRAIREDIGDCTRCRLAKQGRKQIVFGVGNPRAELMFIGEAPGADEDQQGEPFVGRAGQLLNAMLLAIGLPRETVFIANILKCRPPGNRDPRPEEVARCLPFLQAQIALLKPKIMLAVGRIAAQNLLATDAPLARLRGKLHRFGEAGTPLVITYHPAYLLRTPSDKRKAWEDLKFARAAWQTLGAN